MHDRHLLRDVIGNRRIAMMCALSLLAACSSDPDSTGEGPRICTPKTKTTALPGPTSTNGLTAVASFGANPGGLKMYAHAPAGGKADAVVVALHGCTQSAAAYVSAGWNDLADKAGFAVVYAEQTSSNNSQQCFRWFDSAHTTRGKGEAASIAAIAQYAKKQYGASHVYVTGLSAGGAMTAVMLATYPDVFEAGAVMAGLPYACATSQLDAYSCMSPGKDKTPEAWAALVPKLAGANAPRVSIWQGDKDYTVNPSNLKALVRQWTKVNGVADTPSASNTEGKGAHDEYRDSSGVVRVESWTISGMSHGVSVDPSGGCGAAGAYVIDEGLCSTRKAASFFGLVAADPAAPGASNPSGGISTPASNGTTDTNGTGGTVGTSGAASDDCD